MKIIDTLYGEEEITEQVLIELIQTPEMRRLEGISQLGLMEGHYHIKTYSRLEHSIGVMLILRRLGAKVKEQTAGLLHDISHTTFSHVIDWLYGDPTAEQLQEDYQDNQHLEVILNSSIPPILMKNGFDPEEISDINKFTLLEQPLPLLCADRVDYALREMNYLVSPESVCVSLEGLINYKSQMVFKDINSAEVFANGYMQCQIEDWGSRQGCSRWYFFSQILKKGLERNYISPEDFHETDDYVLGLLRGSGDKEIIGDLDFLENKFKIRETKDGSGVQILKKFRHVDPLILMNGGLVPFTEISSEYKNLLETERKKSLDPSRIIFERNQNEHRTIF